MTDQQLLLLAARAAGYPIVGEVDDMIVQPGHFAGGFVIRNKRGGDSPWNPLTDDADAFRLGVLLRLEPRQVGNQVLCGSERTGPNEASIIQEFFKEHRGDIFAAQRRALVRAAAERGKEIW